MKKNEKTNAPVEPDPDCTCYGRGQCASCTLRIWKETGERPETEIVESLRKVGLIR